VKPFTKTGIVFQVRRYLGEDGLDEAAIARIARALNDNARCALVRDAVKTPGWMRAVV
jgi:hypothetical protein